MMEAMKKMNKEVVSDKKLCKAMTCYVEEDKRDLFTVTVFDGKSQFSAKDCQDHGRSSKCFGVAERSV